MAHMRVAAAIWLFGAAVYLVSEAIAAADVSGYSYTADFISDLGVRAVINVGAFMVHGILLLLGALVLTRGGPSGGARFRPRGRRKRCRQRSGRRLSECVRPRTLARGRCGDGDHRWQCRGDRRRHQRPGVGRDTDIPLGQHRTGRRGHCLPGRADHRRRQRISGAGARTRRAWCGVSDHRLGTDGRCGDTPPPWNRVRPCAQSWETDWVTLAAAKSAACITRPSET